MNSAKMNENCTIELREIIPIQTSEHIEVTEASDEIQQPDALFGTLRPAITPVEASEVANDGVAEVVDTAPMGPETNSTENETPLAKSSRASTVIDVPHDDENPGVASTNPPSSPAESLSGSQSPRPQEPSKLIVLRSDVPFSQSWSAWAFAISSSIFTISTIFYIWWTSFATFKLKFQDPQWTVFTIAVLSYVSAVLLNGFTETMCDVLRWKFSRHKPKGISLLNFLALSQATFPLGLIFLLVHVGGSFKLSVFSEHRLWCIMRLILVGAKFAVAVILLFNLQINTVFIPEDASVSSEGGVSDLNYWVPWTTIDDINSGKLSTLMYLKNVGHTTYDNTPTLDVIDRTCPAGMSRCAPLSFIQGWTALTRPELDAGRAKYVTLRQTPFYIFYMNYFEEQFNFTNDCNSYICPNTQTGLTGNWSVCARSDPVHNALAFRHIYDECDPRDRRCHNVLDAPWRLVITRQSADLTYSFRNDSILHMDNVNEESEERFGMDAELYLTIFDKINSPVSDFGIERYIFYVMSGFFGNYRTMANVAMAIFMYPFFTQQQNYQGRKSVTYVNASYTAEGYTISLAPRSIFVFTSFNLAMLLCGLALFAKASWRGMPRASEFPDVELILHGLSQAQTAELEALVSKFQITGASRRILNDIDEYNILVCPTSLSDLEAEAEEPE